MSRCLAARRWPLGSSRGSTRGQRRAGLTWVSVGLVFCRPPTAGGHQCRQVERGVEVAIQGEPALAAAECALGQAQLGFHCAAARARLGGRVPAARDHNAPGAPRGLVADLAPQSRPSRPRPRAGRAAGCASSRPRSGPRPRPCRRSTRAGPTACAARRCERWRPWRAAGRSGPESCATVLTAGHPFACPARAGVTPGAGAAAALAGRPPAGAGSARSPRSTARRGT